MGKTKQTPKDTPNTPSDDDADVSGHSLLHEQVFRDEAARRAAEADRWARDHQRAGKTQAEDKTSSRRGLSRFNVLAPTIGLLTLVILGISGA